MNNLDTLREWFPWPAESPGLPEDFFGWLGDDTQKMLRRQIPGDAKLIVEVGSWLGKSARFILRLAPQATLVCIDTWLGSSEHYRAPVARHWLPTLHKQFLSNLWQYRERVVPVRATSSVGLDVLRLLDIRPDSFYIDGSHEAVDVRRDIGLAAALNPAAAIVGDDWKWPTVRQGVQAAMKALPGERSRQNNSNSWAIV